MLILLYYISLEHEFYPKLFCWQVLANAERPMILVGNTVLLGQEGSAIHQTVADMSLKLKKLNHVEKDWKVLNVLHRVCNCLYNGHCKPHLLICVDWSLWSEYRFTI